MSTTRTELPLIADASRPTAMHATLFVLLAAAIVVARGVLLATFGTDTPYWDQWDSEIALLYKPFMDGTLGVAQLFAPHNEHRIFFSRVFDLLLFAANDYQFDNRVETFANVFLYTGALLLFAAPILRRLHGANLLLGAVVDAFVGIAPYGAENLLTGFQNGFYFLNAFAAGAIALVALRDGATALAGAFVLAVASLFTLASGLLLAPTLAFVALARWRAGELSGRRTLIATVVAATIAIAGLMLMPTAPGHDALQPHGLADLARAALAVTSWPLPGSFVSVALLWWPSAFVLWRSVRHRGRGVGAIDRYVLGIAAWVMLQQLAIAYARGHDAAIVYSRYTDTLALGPLANLVLALRLLHAHLPDNRRRALACAVAVYAVLATGVFAAITAKWSGLLYYSARNYEENRVNLRAYLSGQGRRAFFGKRPVDISYPTAERLSALLDDPTIRELMPASVRAPIPAKLQNPCVGFAPLATAPPTPPMPYAIGSSIAGVGDAATGSCRGAPFSAKRPYLQWRVAGLTANAGLSLSMTSADGTSIDVAAPKAVDHVWLPVTLRAPGTPVGWTAVDDSTNAAFAFTPPVETGRLSAWCQSISTALNIAPPGFWR